VEEVSDDATTAAFNRMPDHPAAELRETVYIFPPRLFTRRYEMRLKLDESEDPVAEISSKLKEFYKQLLSSDKKMVVYPWKEIYNKGSVNARKYKALTRPSDIPTQPGGWKVYFERANPVAKGGWTYPSIFLGHNKEFEAIMEDIRWWLQTS
jgi:hypothetical protein